MSEAIVKPTKERQRHGKVELLGDQVVDARGDIGAPYYGLSLLDQWERAGRITKEMYAAGNEFHRLFRLACLEPLVAADMGRVGGGAARDDHRGALYARDRVHEAVQALGGMGSPAGACAWFVLGCEYSIRQWAAREVWRGRAMTPNVASGVLIGSLGSLKGHFGY